MLAVPVSSFAQQSTPSSATGKNPKSEVSISYSFGFSNRIFQVPGTGDFTRVDHSNARSYYDQGYTLKYNYAVYQRKGNRLLAGTGLGLFNSRHFQPLTDRETSYSLANVIFDSKALCIPLSVSYERALWNNRLFLELGYSENLNLPLEKQTTYTGSELKKHGFIDYSYQVNVRRENYRTRSISLASKFKLKEQLFFNFSVSYLTGKKLHYNYNYTTTSHMSDLTTGKDYVSATASASLPDISIKDNYLYLSAGLAYRF